MDIYRYTQPIKWGAYASLGISIVVFLMLWSFFLSFADNQFPAAMAFGVITLFWTLVALLIVPTSGIIAAFLPLKLAAVLVAGSFVLLTGYIALKVGRPVGDPMDMLVKMLIAGAALLPPLICGSLFGLRFRHNRLDSVSSSQSPR